MTKVFFKDLSERVQESLKEEVKANVLAIKESEIQTEVEYEMMDAEDDEVSEEIENRLYEYENSDELEEDIEDFINRNDKGLDYEIIG